MLCMCSMLGLNRNEELLPSLSYQAMCPTVAGSLSEPWSIRSAERLLRMAPSILAVPRTRPCDPTSLLPLEPFRWPLAVSPGSREKCGITNHAMWKDKNDFTHFRMIKLQLLSCLYFYSAPFNGQRQGAALVQKTIDSETLLSHMTARGLGHASGLDAC